MKNKYLAVFLVGVTLLSSIKVALALSPYDTRIMQRDPTNTFTGIFDLPLPPGGASGIYGVSGLTSTPTIMYIGSGLSFNTGSLNLAVSGVPTSSVAGLPALLDSKASVSQMNSADAALQSQVNAKATTTSLSPVAFSGAYSDLTGKPSIPAAQAQSDWTQASSGSPSFILNKPSLAAVATTGAYSSLAGTPSLALVATSGAYADLTGRPSLAAVATSGAYADLTGRPSLSTVATTGLYNDLTGRPSLATVATSGAYADLSGKPALAAVATSGNYFDLSNRPATTTVALTFNNSASRSIVTGTGATGFQVSSAQNSVVNYAVNIQTTATIGGASDGYVAVEIASTNSAAAGDWVEVGSRCRNGQTITLAVALNSVQNVGCNISAVIPAGYYLKLRSVNVSGTPAYTYVSGQEVKM